MVELVEVFSEGGDFGGGDFGGKLAAVVEEGGFGVDALVEQFERLEFPQAYRVAVRLQAPQRRLLRFGPLLLAGDCNARDRGLLLELVLRLHAPRFRGVYLIVKRNGVQSRQI